MARGALPLIGAECSERLKEFSNRSVDLIGMGHVGGVSSTRNFDYTSTIANSVCQQVPTIEGDSCVFGAMNDQGWTRDFSKSVNEVFPTEQSRARQPKLLRVEFRPDWFPIGLKTFVAKNYFANNIEYERSCLVITASKGFNHLLVAFEGFGIVDVGGGVDEDRA